MKTTVRHLLRLVAYCTFVVLSAHLFCSCSDDDDDQLPSILTDLVCMEADHEGLVNFMTFDDGTRLGLVSKLKSESKDTVLRCLCMYSMKEGLANVHSARVVLASEPQPRSEVKLQQTDPVKFVSAWRTPLYLNINIGVMTSGAALHDFAFALDSIAQNATSGCRTAYFTLMHKRPEADAESFTADDFMSLPLRNYADCDSIALTINTYEGLKAVVR